MTLQTNDITTDDSFYIQELQGYLRSIQRERTGETDVPADGIYGGNTRAAVTAFQQEAGLPATGQVDRVTWETIRAAYLEIQAADALHLPIQAYQNPDQFLQPDDQGDGVAFLQIMLRRLAVRYPNLQPIREVNGLYNEETTAAVRAVQRLAGLPITGVTDKATWNAIVRLYNDG